MIPTIRQWIDRHYAHPKGWMGRFIGRKMISQHKTEVMWTIEQMTVRPHETILELGCGAGAALQQFHYLFPDVQLIGLDQSKTMVTAATKRNRKAIHQGAVRLIQGDFHHPPLPAASVHHIFSIHTLYFWNDLTLVLVEMKRILLPSGTFHITYCDGKSDETWETVRSRVSQELIPIAQSLGFDSLTLLRGPVSRGYHTVAIHGTLSSVD